MLRTRDIFLFPFGFSGDVNYIHPRPGPKCGAGAAGCSPSMPCCSPARSCCRRRAAVGVAHPAAVGAPLLRLYLLCEHTLCPNSDDGFANTRTTLSNPAGALHHVEPAVPRRASPAAQHRLPSPARSAPAPAAAPQVRGQELHPGATARSCGASHENQRRRLRVRRPCAAARRHAARARASSTRPTARCRGARQRHRLSDELLARSTPTSNGWSTSSTASIPAATSSSSPTCSPTGCRPRRRTTHGAFPR